MPELIIIYGKEKCPHTRRARDAYPQARFIDVLADPDGLAQMLACSNGTRRVPVIVKGDDVEIGFKRGS